MCAVTLPMPSLGGASRQSVGRTSSLCLAPVTIVTTPAHIVTPLTPSDASGTITLQES